LSSSTHNTRIERLWVEVGSQFARRWRAFFYRLEALHGLDRTNPHHLWLLHLLFLDLINVDCANFRAEWNCHPISGEGHDQSPDDMCFLGQVKDGIYVDEVAGIHPDVLNQYYGVHGPEVQRRPGETGAGQLPDEDVPAPDLGDMDELDWEDLDDRVEAAQESNFHHEAVAVPKYANPFTSDETLHTFHQALAIADAQGVVPEGYGLLPDEWEDGTYPSFETLKSGRRGGKELQVPLPDFIWRPRAEMWGRGLEILNQLTYINEE
ncbi:hypothetical protein DFH07DRAFT_755339, partial [Mycena maculata]